MIKMAMIGYEDEKEFEPQMTIIFVSQNNLYIVNPDLFRLYNYNLVMYVYFKHTLLPIHSLWIFDIPRVELRENLWMTFFFLLFSIRSYKKTKNPRYKS